MFSLIFNYESTYVFGRKFTCKVRKVGIFVDKRIKVIEIMNKGLITVKRNEDLKIACITFLENNIDGVGVVERDGTLCGILSKTDITRAVASMN